MSRLKDTLYFAFNIILILLGFIFHFRVNESIGDNIIATGIVGIIMYWAIHVTRERSKKDRELLNEMSEFGIERIYNERLIRDVYQETRERTTGSFDVMGFGLRTFVEDNSDKFVEWSKKFNIRILVVDPNTQYCSQRDYEEEDPKGKIKADVDYVTRVVKQLNNPKIQIRWYNAIPVTNIFRLGDTMFIGPYFARTRSRNSITIQLKAGGILFDRYLNHFNTVWNDQNLSHEPVLGE